MRHSRPEPLYFWFYFVFVNSIWVVIPALVLWRAACQVTRAAAASEALCAPSARGCPTRAPAPPFCSSATHSAFVGV